MSDRNRVTTRYISTRGGDAGAGFDQALLNGLAGDGGLYVPETWPDLPEDLLNTERTTSYAEISGQILKAFAGDALPEHALTNAAEKAAASFSHPAVTPLKQIGDGLWLLELFHGPTMAFKDCAMQLMARLTQSALERSGERLLLITATSGDTGAAAVNAFAGADHIDIVVLHPKGRVSPVQRRQMTTVDAQNVLNLAVRGDFDDCQLMVKALLSDDRLRAQRRVSSVNSINWGRLAGQIPYYIVACRALGGRARFVVPTGNFGDAFAGWVARRLGVGVAGLTAAVNTNDALVRALDEGVYAREKAVATASVSMDVQAPSNFERLVFEASGRKADTTAHFFADFAATGRAEIAPDLQAALRREVTAQAVTEDETALEMARVRLETGEYICPHTAVGVSVARRLPDDGAPRVVLATAHAAKFPDAVEAAVGRRPPRPKAIAALEDKPERAIEIDPTVNAARSVIMDMVALA